MDKYVKSVKESIQEAIDFFGNSRKVEREKWVACEFLSYLVENLNESEIQESTQEPVDVTYNKIGFQVKEVPSEGVKRGKEYKDALRSINDNTKPSDLLEPYKHEHIPLNNALPRLVSELERHRMEKYYGATNDINVLVYLNLTDTTYDDTEIDYSLIEEEIVNWLSVFVVTNNCAIILRCKDHSLELLDRNVGQLIFEKK
ncbi:MAG TPA: DUF1780 domain-containing protein [Methylobacter sp.]|jgi:hypothetical protein